MASIRDLPRTGSDIRALPHTGTNYSSNQRVNSVPTNSSLHQSQPSILGASASNTGGGGNRPQAPQQPTQWTSPEGQIFGNQDEYYRQIDDAYKGSYDYLNQAESAVRGDLPNALAEAESIYKTNQSQLDNSKANANTTLNQQKTKAMSTKDSALADARRMFQEQSIGAQQRFGGASSAGQAFSEIQARELARQQGSTQRQFTEIDQGIETQRAQVDREYQTGLLQLEQQKQSAITSANRDFQNKLLQISQNRAQLGQAKAEARLGALSELRNQIFAINQQTQQFQQALELQRQASGQAVSGYGSAINPGLQQLSSAVSAYDPMANSQQSMYGATQGMNQGAQQPQFTGAISTGKKDEKQGSFLGNAFNGALGAVSPYFAR